MIEYFVVPEVALLGWYVLNRKAAKGVAETHSGEDAMLQHLRDYLHEGYEVESRLALLQLTESVSGRAFQCVRQQFFIPTQGGWKHENHACSYDEASLLSAIAAQGQPIDRRFSESILSPELLQAAYRFMDHHGVNVLIPVSDSMAPQWVWASYCPERRSETAVDALQAWKMAMESVVERWALRLASAHLAELEKDAASATQVLRVLLPEEPIDTAEGLEWAGVLHRAPGEPPVLYATYAQESGKVLVVFAEIAAPGLAAVILASALRGFCNSLVAAAKSTTLRPEKVLGLLNRYVWRPDAPSDLSCIVALFDTNSRRIDYAAAGSPDWIQLKENGDLISVAATGPGLGASEDINYLPQSLPLEPGDSHFFIGSELGTTVFSDPLIAKQALGHRSVGFVDLGRYIDSLANALDQHSDGEGRTPALVVLRPASY